MSSLPLLSLFFHQKPSLARELLGSLFKIKTKQKAKKIILVRLTLILLFLPLEL